jgi:hypothetical protein
MQLNACGVRQLLKPESSQFPLWDFFECNKELYEAEVHGIHLTLNSLCGISLNATALLITTIGLFSTSFELSIPFVGFL